jgi:hypothetical protein
MGSIRRGRSAVHSVASAGSNSFSQLRADTHVKWKFRESSRINFVVMIYSWMRERLRGCERDSDRGRDKDMERHGDRETER